MRLSRVLIVTLALMVSPVSAAVCEVVCVIEPHTAHQAEAAPAIEANEHAHHGHHSASAPTVAPAATATTAPEVVGVSAGSPANVSISIPAPECDLRAATPARVRTTSHDTVTLSSALQPSASRLDYASTRHPVGVGATASPPAPPPNIALPLRI